MQVMSDDVSPTLREQMKHHEPIVCYAIENDPTLKIDTKGVGFSLRAREPKDPQIVCYAEKRFCEWYEDKKGVTLRASSGSYGGGKRSACLYQRTVGALCGTDHKWIQQQQVMQGKLIVECLTKK